MVRASLVRAPIRHTLADDVLRSWRERWQTLSTGTSRRVLSMWHGRFCGLWFVVSRRGIFARRNGNCARTEGMKRSLGGRWIVFVRVLFVFVRVLFVFVCRPETTLAEPIGGLAET